MAQFETFAGIDWSATSRQAAVVDAGGQLLGEQAFAHSGEGLLAMAGWILGHCPEGPAAAAIEKPHGPEVEALLERGIAVFAPDPKQLDRFRDRLSPADRKAFREVETPPPDIIRLRELSRSESDATAERTSLINKLTALPGRCHPSFLDAVSETAAEIVKRLKACNEGLKRIRKRIKETLDRIKAAEGGRVVEILESVPGIGTAVLAAIVSEAFDSIRRADRQALRCYSGVAPAARRSGQGILVQHRRAANQRLADAAHHWAMAAIQRDDASRRKYRELRSRGHKHARALRSVADRLLGVVCKMIETGQAFDPERRSKRSA